MSFYARYGAFGGGAPELFPGGPTFMGASDQGVFYGSDAGFIAGAKNQGYTWVPAPLTWQKAAAAKWAALSDPNASDADVAFKQSMLAQLNTLLNSFYNAVGNHSILGYSGDATQQIVAVGSQLKDAVKALIGHQLQPQLDLSNVTTAANPNGTPQVSPSGTVPRGAQPYPTTDGGSPYSIGTSSLQQGATAVAAPDNTTLYLALAGGAVAVIGGLLLFARRKASATAGYRRRHRRSRR